MMVDRNLWSFRIILNVLFIFLCSVKIVYALDNSIQLSQDFLTNVQFDNNTKRSGRSIFVYRKSGLRLDIRLVRGVNDSSSEEEDDRFPMPPIRELGHCVIDVSAACIKNRISRYIDSVSDLDKITLFGSTVKLVKVRELPTKVSNYRGMNSIDKVNRSINDFFNKYALRITLPGWNKRKEQNQIDFMFDDPDLTEGRRKGGHHKHEGGDEYKQMMMCMMIALKMNMMGMMGLAMLKGMMMSGISMIMTKAMLLMKLMEWNGGKSSTGKVEKILLVTKTSGDGNGAGWHGLPPHSSYGEPPSLSGGHHGGGWGRSLDNPLPMKTLSNQYPQTNTSQRHSNNFSTINTDSESNRTNYSRYIENHEHVGAVHKLEEIKRKHNYSQKDNINDEKIIDVENKL